MFVRWNTNYAGRQFGIMLYVFGSDFWRVNVCFLNKVLSFGRSAFYKRRKQEVRDAS